MTIRFSTSPMGTIVAVSELAMDLVVGVAEVVDAVAAEGPVNGLLANDIPTPVP